MYIYLTLILFNTIHSFAHVQMIPSINMIYKYFNLGTQLKKGSLTIQLNIIHLFTYS